MVLSGFKLSVYFNLLCHLGIYPLSTNSDILTLKTRLILFHVRNVSLHMWETVLKLGVSEESIAVGPGSTPGA